MISVKDLHKSFGGVTVLDGISTDIEKGDVVCIIGPSGSGKSTFLRCLNRLETPDSGKILLDGVDLTDPAADLNRQRMKMGMVFQQFNLFPHMTVLKNLTLAPMLLKKESQQTAEARAMALLERVGLGGASDRPTNGFSVGMKQRLGIAHQKDRIDAVLTGAMLNGMSDAELKERVLGTRVYARVDPAQKIRIVQSLQSHGQFVAMTGDGVNDAPALKQADIGVAMGRGGTDVAREASSLVLLDDNFATIVAAVREGRRIYDNIRKFVRYAMTGNSAEVMTLAFAPLLGLPMPLLPIHILWVNLVTDGLPGLALAAEPAERGIMQRAPRHPKESLFAHGMGWHIIWVGFLLTVFCLGLQYWAIHHGDNGSNAHWQTMVFTTLTLGQMAHVMAIRSESDSLFTQGLLSNKPLLGAVALTFVLQMATIYVPFLHPIFKTQTLTLGELAVCLGLAGMIWVAVEIEKAWKRYRQHGKHHA